MIKYLDYSIVLKEHPEYVSLAFRITNCPLRCLGCHSPELQQDIGKELTCSKLRKTIICYRGMIENVIFMGGDHTNDLIDLLKACKTFNLKTTLWTGAEKVKPIFLKWLDFTKTGAYNSSLGGLDSPTTNQKYIEVRTGRIIKI